MTTTTPALTVRVLGSDFRGTVAAADGIVFYLTACCRASAKGSSNSPSGVCCRECYRPVSGDMGTAWLVSDRSAWQRYGVDSWDAAHAAGANDTLANRAVIARAVERTMGAARAV
jgi:hypothetical protein